MANSWKVAARSIEVVKADLDAALASSSIPSFVNLGWEGQELCMRVEKMGKSEFRLALRPSGDGVEIAEIKRQVAFAHRPFLDKVESTLDGIMAKVCARRA